MLVDMHGAAFHSVQVFICASKAIVREFVLCRWMLELFQSFVAVFNFSDTQTLDRL